jgi:2-dehydropantoate 2-reductase
MPATMDPTIHIIGAGAIGKALAIALQHEGRPVQLWQIRPSGQLQPSLQFRMQLPDGQIIEEKIAAASLSASGQLQGILLLSNKSFVNKELAILLKNKIKDAPIVLLQNGLNVEKAFIERAFPAVYRCVLMSTSQEETDGLIRFKPVSVSPVGITKGNGAELTHIVGLINSRHFPFRAEMEIESFIWKKAIINCAFNAICPLMEADNGLFYRNDYALNIAITIMKAGKALAARKGIILDDNEMKTALLQISKSSQGQEISTLQDIRRGRPTELENLHFEMHRIAVQEGCPELVREILLMGELTRLKSELSKITVT